MKNKIKFLIIGCLLLLGMGACTVKDLTLSPDGAEVPENFYKTNDQLLMALYAAYDPLQNGNWWGTTYMWGSIASDDAVGGGADESDQLDFNLADRRILTPYTSKDQNNLLYWTNWWVINTRCNYLLKYAPKTTALGKEALAEGYFLKAMAYFWLTRMYGGLPIIDKVPSITDKIPRASQADTWAAIEGYLNNAINVYTMPVRTGGQDPFDGMPTLATAQTLLGKVYLYEGKYSDAITVLEQVAQNSQYSLCQKYSDVFNPALSHGVESIFEINFSKVTSPNTNGGFDINANSNNYATLTGPRTGEATIPAPCPFAWGWGMNQPTQKLASAFDAMGDTLRKKNSIVSSDSVRWYFTNVGKTIIMSNPLTGWWDLKHIRRNGFYAASSQVGQNIIVFRLSDVYLMLAEAYNKTQQDASALTYLNKVRTRAGLAPANGSGAGLLTQIKKERQLELCLEGDRYFDLVRWGDAATEMTAEIYDSSSNSYTDGTPGASTNGLWPIPKQEMDKMTGVAGFNQNPGY